MTCGIYNWINDENGKRYIGQSKDVYNREKSHLVALRRNKNNSRHLQHAYNKYGEKSLRFEVMILCDKKDLDFYEDLLIHGYKANDPEFGYNIRKVAANNRGMVINKGVFNPGDKYGRLTLVRREKQECGEHNWITQCDCGTEAILNPARAKFGSVKSCGCYNSEEASKRRKARTDHGMSKSREYSTWNLMMQRCYNEDNEKYKTTGRLGISVCQEWHDFKTFFRDMGEKPEGIFLGRKDVTKNYDKDNCYWATSKQLCANKRKRK